MFFPGVKFVLQGFGIGAEIVGADQSPGVTTAIVNAEVSKHGQRLPIGMPKGQYGELRIDRTGGTEHLPRPGDGLYAFPGFPEGIGPDSTGFAEKPAALDEGRLFKATVGNGRRGQVTMRFDNRGGDLLGKPDVISIVQRTASNVDSPRGGMGMGRRRQNVRWRNTDFFLDNLFGLIVNGFLDHAHIHNGKGNGRPA